MYLDNAATASYTAVEDIILSTMTDAMKEYWMNPSSLYASDVKDEIDKCRANIAKFIGAKPNEIIFTSGASESNNMAIRGWSDYALLHSIEFTNIITTRIEHKSILATVQSGMLGARIHYCNVDKFGLIDYESLTELLEKCGNEHILVSIGMANNEIGTIQDVSKVADLVHRHNGILHIDATQALPHIPINVESLGIDMLSASGHKISPLLKGVGFLYKKNSVNICPLIYGSQEGGLRGGTENTFSIIGLGRAVKYCDVSDKNILDMYDKLDYFVELLRCKFGCKLNGCEGWRLPNNINVTFPQNITGESLLYTLDLSNIQISTGSACNSSLIEPSHVLKEIGLTDEEAMRTIRITVSDDITYEEIDHVVDEIGKAIKIIEA